ncbi:MAG: DUF3617 domain-containing protein [Steroidobacteraceae bacterium]
MKRIALAATALLVTVAYAADPKMKPGLWEIHVTKNIMDAHDQTTRSAAMTAQMQQAMAMMPPEQRARVEAAMKQNPGGSGTVRTCITPEMANRNTPVTDQTAHCPPASVKRSGDHVSYDFSCVINGMSATGKGESTVSSELVTTRSEVTLHASNGTTHLMQNESQMRFIGADCGDVKPLGAATTH